MNEQQREQILDYVTGNLALIPVSSEIYDEIYMYSKRNGTGGAGAVAAIVEHQLWDFLDRNKDYEEPEGESVFWRDPKTGKTLELHHGTELSTNYFGDKHVAKIVDGKIQWNGKVFTSPAQACNAMRGGTQNNAWREFSVKRLGDTEFKPAQRFR